MIIFGVTVVLLLAVIVWAALAIPPAGMNDDDMIRMATSDQAHISQALAAWEAVKLDRLQAGRDARIIQDVQPVEPVTVTIVLDMGAFNPVDRVNLN